MAALYGASGDSPVLLQQQPPDPTRSMLAQALAQSQQLAAPRTGQAALMQGLAAVLSNGAMGFMNQRDRREKEEAGNEFQRIATGQPAPAESPGLLQRAANFVGLGDDKPTAPTAGPSLASTTPTEPGRLQLASALAGGVGAPDAPAGAPMPSARAPASTGAPLPSAPATPAAPMAPTSARDQIAQMMNSKNPIVRAQGLNRLQAFEDQRQKFEFERDKDDASKGLRTLPDGTVVGRTNYGTSKGRITAEEYDAVTPSHLARTEGEKKLTLKYEPLTKEATTRAETQPLLDRANQMVPIEARKAGAVTTATETAALPFVEPKATAQSRGTTTGTIQAQTAPITPEVAARLPAGVTTMGGAGAAATAAGSASGTAAAELAPAPAAPGLTPGKTIAESVAEAKARAAQAAQGTGPNQQRESQLRGDFDALPAVKAYRQTAKEYGGIVDASKRDNKTANLNMVYGLAKILDPESVVREGEVTTVKNTASWPEYLKGAISTLEGGGNLSPETRAQIVREARGRVEAGQGVYNQFRQAYHDIAGRNGLDHRNVVVDLADPLAAGPQSAPEPITVPTVAPLVLPQGRSAAAAPAPQSIPTPAIDALRAGTGTPEQFDAIFGPGAANRALGR